MRSLQGLYAVAITSIISLVIAGCDSQTRSPYEVDGTVNGQPATFTIRGVENTATSTPNVAAIVSATTAGLRGDLAGVMAQVGQLVNKPDADPPYAERGASIAAIIGAISLAYAKHREAQSQKADANEGWQKAAEAQREALSLAKALPPDRVPT